MESSHCVESVHIWSSSGPYFPAIGLNTNIYEVKLRILCKCWKIRTRKTPNTDTFHAVNEKKVFMAYMQHLIERFSENNWQLKPMSYFKKIFNH